MSHAARGRALVAAIGLLLALSVLLHASLAWKLDGFLDPDEAIVGLMARHVRAGLSRPVFYYGQPYLGALEAYLVAPLSALASFPLAARLALTLFALALATATADAAGRAGGAAAAVTACALATLAPPDAFLWHLKLRGGFIEAAALLAVALAASFRVLERPHDRRPALVFGLAAGLAFWTNQLTGPALAVLAAALLLGGRRRVLGLAAAGLGSLPFWIENAAQGGATFRYLAAHYVGQAAEAGANTEALFADALPRLLGGPTLALATGLPPLRLLGLAIAGALLLALAAVRARPIAAALRARQPPAPGDLALLALLVSLPARRNAQLNQLLHWIPLIAVLLAVAPAALGRRRAYALPAALAGLGAVELLLWLPGFSSNADAPRALVELLEARGVRAVHAEHRPAYLVAYHSGERIAAAPSLSSGYFVDRWPPYTDRVRQDPAPAFVFEAGSGNEARFLHERRAEAIGEGPVEVRGYHVYFTRPAAGVSGVDDGAR